MNFTTFNSERVEGGFFAYKFGKHTVSMNIWRSLLMEGLIFEILCLYLTFKI